jgi:hypothetical protein
LTQGDPLPKLSQEMRPLGAAKHFVLAFVITAIAYAAFYKAIEQRRVRNGPWEVTFTNTPSVGPTLIINQPKLNIRNVQVQFPGAAAAEKIARPDWRFAEAKATPFEVPFGKCVFLDTTFLPGTVALEVCGHEVQLLPRVLMLDRREQPWVSGAAFDLHPPAKATPAKDP